MSGVIAWVDQVPPKADNFGRPPGDRYKFVELLKTRPGRWAQYKPGYKHSASGSSIMKQDFPGIEATYRPRLDGGNDIYARWIG